MNDAGGGEASKEGQAQPVLSFCPSDLVLIFHRNISFSTVLFAQGAVVVLGGRQPAFVLRLAPHKKPRRYYESFLLNISIRTSELPYPPFPISDIRAPLLRIADREVPLTCGTDRHSVLSKT
jgi:hypothetical protein